MGIEAQDLLAQLGVEPAHDADDDDQHRDTQRDAQHGNQCDHRDERPFGPQVPQRQQQFERQPRHAPEARRPAAQCQSIAQSPIPSILHSAFPSSVAVLRRVDFLLHSPRGSVSSHSSFCIHPSSFPPWEPCGSFGVALWWLWGRNQLAINRPWGGFVVALGDFAPPCETRISGEKGPDAASQQSDASCKSVVFVSGRGPVCVVQGSDIQPLTRVAMWL